MICAMLPLCITAQESFETPSLPFQLLAYAHANTNALHAADALYSPAPVQKTRWAVAMGNDFAIPELSTLRSVVQFPLSRGMVSIQGSMGGATLQRQWTVLASLVMHTGKSTSLGLGLGSGASHFSGERSLTAVLLKASMTQQVTPKTCIGAIVFLSAPVVGRTTQRRWMDRSVSMSVGHQIREGLFIGVQWRQFQYRGTVVGGMIKWDISQRLGLSGGYSSNAQLWLGMQVSGKKISSVLAFASHHRLGPSAEFQFFQN